MSLFTNSSRFSQTKDRLLAFDYRSQIHAAQADIASLSTVVETLRQAIQ
jgi:hypothetical protein